MKKILSSSHNGKYKYEVTVGDVTQDLEFQFPVDLEENREYVINRIGDKIICSPKDEVTELFPETDEFFFTTGDSQTKTLKHTPFDGKVKVYVNGNRIYSTQYNLTNGDQVEILDDLSDGDPIAIDYHRLIVTLLLLTPQGGISSWSIDRNSIATYVDENGIIQTAAINEPRVDYSTGKPVLLVEGQSSNLVSFSEDLGAYLNDDSGKSILTSTDSDSLILGGKITTFNEGLENSRHVCWDVLSGLTSGNLYTFSVFVKDIDRRFIFIQFGSFDRYGIVLDTQTSDINPIVRDAPSNYSHKVVNMKNGWFKVSITMTCDDASNFYAIIGGSDALNPLVLSTGKEPVYLGTGKEFYFTGYHIEPGSATSYIPTNGTTVTRLADVITIAPPIGTTQITEVINGNTNIVYTIPATYQIPNGNVSKIEMK